MNLEEVINSYVVEDDPNVQTEVATNLARNFTLLQIVVGLEDPLTQDDGLVRSKATKCLADVIHSLTKLSAQEVNVLTVFLSDRLSDSQSVANAAMGLSWLFSKDGVAPPLNEEFWSKLKAVNMLNLDIDARYEIFKLLESLSYRTISEPFVSVFVALAGGEKDPRNLMLNLEISRRILKNKGMSLDSERRAEVYDITFCYFPVKFHPPKDMPYKITAEEIKENLERTLSRPEIAEWVIPALIAKLTAVSVTVKLDSLKALDETLKNVSETGDIHPYWRQVWDGLKFEVLHGTPENDTYKPVIQILSRFVGLPEFIDDVKTELAPEQIPKSKLFQLCQLIIGLSTTEDIWKELAPLAIEKCLDQPVVLNLFLSTKYPVPHVDQVFQALLRGIAQDHRKDGIEGLKLLANSIDGADFVPLIIQTLTQEKAYTELAELAPAHQKAISEYALPQLFSGLPETLDPLSKICCVRSLVQSLSVRMLARLELDNMSSALKLLKTIIDASAHLTSATEFIGFDRVWTMPLLHKLVDSKHITLSDTLVDQICVLMERAARGVPIDFQPAYAKNVIGFLGRTHFHILLSSLAAMKEFPFEHGFIQDYAVPKLRESKDILERAGYLRLIALTANKWPHENADNGVMSPKDDYTAIEIAAWETKGLLLRADNVGFSRAVSICDIALSDPVVATMFGVLAATDRILVKENGCVVRQLFRQRLFMMILPKIGDLSTNSLLVLSALLKYTPQTVVAPKFNTILGMLMSSLNSQIPILQETAVQSIHASLPSSAETLEPQLYVLVPRLLEIATTSSSTATARLVSLETVISLKTALSAEMENFKDMVITTLVPALGDPKRNVRKQAVKCRQLFF